MRVMAAFVDIERWLEGIIEMLDPLHYMTPDQYDLFWREMVGLMFQGNIARFFAVLSLFMALFFGAIKQRFGIGFLCFGASVLFAYLRAFQMWFD